MEKEISGKSTASAQSLVDIGIEKEVKFYL